MDRIIRFFLVVSCLAFFHQAKAQFDDPKTLNMEKPDIKMDVRDEGGKWLVTLSTDRPVFGVWVNASGIAGEFTDNHIALIQGEPRTLEFKPRDAKTTFKDFRKSLSVTHIRATY